MKRARFSRNSIRTILWRWHRRIGLVAALFVLMLAVTGIFINHGDALQLNSSPLPSSLRALFYRAESPSIRAIAVAGQWLSQVDEAHLYLDDQALPTCDGPLVAALEQEPFRLVVCGRELQLYGEQWQLIERVGGYQQLPAPIIRVGFCDRQLCFEAREETGFSHWLLDMEQLLWEPTVEVNERQWLNLSEPPDALRKAIELQHFGISISWERWLLDVHSGRFIGDWGPWFMDIMAILFIFSAISGVTLWWRSSRR